MDAHEIARDALEWLRAQPMWLGAGAVGVVAGLEYVVPPVPGDTVAIAGGVLVAQGVFSAPLVLLVVTVGSVMGAMAAFGVGRLAATQPFIRRLLFRVVDEHYFEAAALKYRRWGKWLIVANRFFPGVRASFLFAAGLFGIPALHVALLSGLSALLWNALLIAAGFALGANLDAVIDFVESYSTVAWIVLVTVIVAFVTRVVMRIRAARAKRPPPAPPGGAP